MHMKKPLVVDFESYYEKSKKGLNVSNLGVPNYVRDSYAYMLAIKGEDFEWVGTVEECQKKFNEDFWTDHQFWAANAVFDETWARRYFPTDRMAPWGCILDQGATSQYAQQVDKMVLGLLGKKIDKSTRDLMSAVHYNELPDDKKQQVLDYCLGDAREEWECLQHLPVPSDIEQRVAAYTRMTNVRGVRVNRELVEKDREALEVARHTSKWDIPWIDDNESPLSTLELAKWCQVKDIPCPQSIAKTDEDCDRLMGLHPELDRVIGLMRSYRKCNTVLEKIRTLENRITGDDILPMEMIYCGARHTRRWSSRGFNIQNLDAQPFELGNGYSVDPRAWIIPRPGKKFLIYDFSQIEPRCLNWLVGNEGLLELIRKGFGLYEAYARSANIWTEDSPLKSSDPKLYKNVKAQVLGLGYGMGAARFNQSMPDLSQSEAQDTVNDWRQRNAGIVGMWRTFDKVIMDTVRSKDRELALQLPTGDVLRHFCVRACHGGFESYTTKADFSGMSKQANLWGGVLTENVTQRMARDIIAEAILELEAAGLPVIFSAHDEVIMEVDDDQATLEDAMKTAEKIMTTPPAWAEGLPLAVEGGVYDHYVK